MNREKASKIYHRKSSTKDELRQALAFLLGVEYSAPAKEVAPFSQCRQFFMEQYEKHAGAPYYWQAKDAAGLAGIIKKLEIMDGSDRRVFQLFEQLVVKLPDWYRQHAFNPVTINSKFNDIILIIRKNNGGKQISDEYKQRILRDLLS